MKIYTADKNCLNILRVSVIVLTFVLIVLCGEVLSFIPIIMIVLSVIFAVVGFFTAIVYLPVYFRKLSYTISDNKIIKKSGFFFYKTQMMQIKTIQFSTTVSTPFSKITGLNFIFLYAYGGMMTVLFLDRHDFDEIDRRLKSVYAGKEDKSVS